MIDKMTTLILLSLFFGFIFIMYVITLVYKGIKFVILFTFSIFKRLTRCEKRQNKVRERIECIVSEGERNQDHDNLGSIKTF